MTATSAMHNSEDTVGRIALQKLENLTPDEFDSILYLSSACDAKTIDDEAWMMYEYIYRKEYLQRYGRLPR